LRSINGLLLLLLLLLLYFCIIYLAKNNLSLSDSEGELKNTYFSFQLQKLQNYKLQITNYKLQITNYKLQITNYKLQITNYKLQITNCKIIHDATFRWRIL
jgi:hypothetical protein